MGGDSALAHVNGRTALPLKRIYIVPAAKHGGADLWEIAASEIVEVVSGRKNFKTAAKIVGRQTLKNSWVVVAEQRLEAESFQQDLQNKPVNRGETFGQNFFNNRVD